MAHRRTAFLFFWLIVFLRASVADAQVNIAWTATGGPTGGSVNALVLAPNLPGVMYAGTNGGVYLTRDDGAHWQIASQGLPQDPIILSLAVTKDPNLVFAGTPKGIYRTRDAGTTWIAINPQHDQSILAIITDPQNPNTIYVGTSTTVLKSDSNGDAWNDIGADLKSTRVWSLVFSSDGSTLYAATDNGIFALRDRGGKWQLSSDGLSENTKPQSIVATQRGYLVGTARGLYRSRDGKSWSAAGGDLANVFARPILNDARQLDRVVAVTSLGIIKSNDGGITWALLPHPIGTIPFVSLALDDKNAIYGGSARGVLKTNDEGTTWQFLNTGLVSTNVHAMLLLPGTAGNPSTLLAATRYGLYRSQDRGSSWSESRSLLDLYVTAFATNAPGADLYVGTASGAIFVSKDGGANFNRVYDNLANNSQINCLALLHLPDNTTPLFAGTRTGGLFRSDDGGQKWQPLTKELNATNVLTLATIAPSILIAGTERGLFRIDLATPNGKWQSLSSTLPVEEARAIVVDPQDSKTMVAWFIPSGLYLSKDGGIEWRAMGRNLFASGSVIRSIMLNPGNSAIIYVGTERDIYRSENGGADWEVVSANLPTHPIAQAIVIDPQSPENIFIGTQNSGVVRGLDRYSASSLSAELMIGAGIAGIILLGALMALLVIWRTRSSVDAQERMWVREWPQWEPAIANALQFSGKANESNLNKIPKRHLGRALQRYMAQHPDDELTLQLSPLSLQIDTFPMIQRFVSHWKAAWEVVDSDSAFKSVTSQIVDQLCTMLGFTRVDERTYKGLIGYVVRAPALRLKIPPRFPIIFLPRHNVEEGDLEALRDLMGVLNMVSYFALIVDLRDIPPTDPRQSIKYMVRQATHDFIVLDGKDIRRLLVAREHDRRLVEIILSQVDLTVISPYVTSGPVPANMFFGREYELKTILRTARDANFAIVGGRKIAKTSVLARVYQLMQDAPEYKPFYLDCQANQSYSEFFEAIDTMWKTPLPTSNPEGFRRLATDLAMHYPSRTIVMLFDEIDGLLQYDIQHGEHLFRIFRALAQEVPVHFIFCGEKRLNNALHDPRAAFFNFCNLMQLTYLSPDEARRVVTDPMQEMGITLESSKLADRIVDLAAGHPNIVQYICQKLIERINQRRERLITNADLNAIGESTQFAEYFVEISWGNATALERLISLLMLDRPEVTVGEVAETLRARGLPITPEQLDAAFNGLTLYSILHKEGPKYTYAAKSFPEILRRSQDVYGLTLSYIEEIRQGTGA